MTLRAKSRKGANAFQRSSTETSEQATALRRENAELKRLLAEQSSFIRRYEDTLRTVQAAASHDLLSPLQNIFGFSRLLQRETDPAAVKSLEYLDFIRRGADRMRLLVQALQEYAENAPWTPEFSKVDLNHTVERALYELRDEFEQSNAAIDVSHLPTLQGDARLLELLFRHLVGNAIKYRSDRTPEIRISDLSTDQEIRIMVDDNGIGLDMEFAQSIFEPLKRLHGPMDRMGAGFGLAICREIASAHGGSVAVAHSDDTGSRFCVTLPRQARKA